MKIYYCSKCGIVTGGNSSPNPGLCPKGGGHLWRFITSDGSIVPQPGYHGYTCRKCGLIVYAKSSPNPSVCIKGGGHLWTKI